MEEESKKFDIKDYSSKEFDEGYQAWEDMKLISSNPYEEYSIPWIEWIQGWKEAQGFSY